ncbi:MAG: hypothetical protein DYG99_12275 [Bacteroidetes bacterium CHB5]|nr:hypothetical protein [Bacteroidetes bacterium CHB5]
MKNPATKRGFLLLKDFAASFFPIGFIVKTKSEKSDGLFRCYPDKPEVTKLEFFLNTNKIISICSSNFF